MIKFQQSQALTSHFESFWSTVLILFFSMPIHQEEALSTTTVLTSTTASTVLSSVASSMAYVEEDDDGQEWRRGRTRCRSKPKQPRPTSVCAALAEKERPYMPTISSDM